MSRLHLVISAAISIGVAACGTPEHRLPDSGGQLSLKLPSGRYGCELGIEVGVERDPQDTSRLQIDWKGQGFAMKRNVSYSGLPRYEHRPSGLVWIDLPWKGILLDSRTGRPLASECTIR